MRSHDVIVESVVAASNARANGERLYSGLHPPGCHEDTEVFDELDCLNVEEFCFVYALYLLGSGAENNAERATQRALAAKFEPLIPMSQNVNLHLILTQGFKMWRSV
jgi:hypothetical protein